MKKLITNNPKLNVGDTVVLLHMENESMSPGLKGVVTRIAKDPFEKDQFIISVNWENGSPLSLLSVSDRWAKEFDGNTISESELENMEFFIKNKDLKKYFNTHLLMEYLFKLRDSGIVNMLGSSRFLYMGRNRIEHEFKYDQVPFEEEYNEVLEMADKVRRTMINGVLKIIEDNNQEPTLERVNSTIARYSTKIVEYYIRLF